MSYSRATNSSMNHSNNLPPEVVMKRDLRKKVLDYHSRRELENLERNAMQNYEHERSDTPMSAAEVGIEAELKNKKLMYENIVLHEQQAHMEQNMANLCAENQELRKDVLCRICVGQKRQVVIMPCCHFVVCGSCSTHMTRCVVCMNPIGGKIMISQ